MPDLLDHLESEHRKVDTMLTQLGDSDPGDARDRLVDELTEALTVHMAVEEQFLYPIVAEVLGGEPVTEADVEHDLARDGLVKLGELARRPGFGAAVDMLAAGVSHHVREEEREIFPRLRDQAAGRLDDLDPARLERQVKAARSTKDDLYRRAQAAEIEGRSTMTKDELAAAVTTD